VQDTFAVVSISELKKDPTGIITRAHGEPVAILENNQPTAYLVPAATFAAMVERLDNYRLVCLIEERQKEKSVRMSNDK
jgi:antitoxin StbD